MSYDKTEQNKSKMAQKILIPILLLCAVFGIWALKNIDNDDNISKSSDKTGSVVSDKSNSPNAENPDFDLEVTEKIDLEKLKSYGLPIVIDFGADYCPPCREMAPVLKELNAELKGKAIIKFIDVGKYQDLAEGYPLRVISTQILINADGNPYKPGFSKAGQYQMYSKKDSGDHVLTAHEGGMTKDQLLEVLKEMGME